MDQEKTINLLLNTFDIIGGETLDFLLDIKDYITSKKMDYIIIALHNTLTGKQASIYYNLGKEKSKIIFSGIFNQTINSLKLRKVNTDPNLNSKIYKNTEILEKQKIDYFIFTLKGRIDLRNKDLSNNICIYMNLSDKSSVKEIKKILFMLMNEIQEGN